MTENINAAKDNSKNEIYLNDIKVVENKLSVDDFINLRKQGPFVEYIREDVEISLQNSLYSITIFNGNKPIGIARIVGDGRIVFFIKDVVVDNEYKGKKIGKMLMQYLFNYIEKHACINAYIALMATPNTESFYEQFGFIRRPNEKHGAGMIMYYQGGKIYEEDSSLR